MAGIKANSVSVTMVDGDTAVDKVKDGYLAGEQIVLSTTPTGATYSWGLARPSGSAEHVVLSSDDDAAPRFTPDVGGYYVVSCVVDSTTTYVLRLSATQTATATWVDAMRLPPKLAASVTAPASGRAIFCDSTTSALRAKKPDGTVVGLVESSAAYASVYVHGGVAAQAGLDTTPVKLACFAADGVALTATPAHASDQVTAGVAGVFEVSCALSFTGSDATVYTFAIAKGGTALNLGGSAVVYVATGAQSHSVALRCQAVLASTDVVTVLVSTDAGGKTITVSEGVLELRQIG